MSEASQTIYRLDYRQLNPVFYHMVSLMMNPKIRRITNYGGSSSGKTYGIAQALLFITEYDGANTIVFRKVGASISKTVWEDFQVAARQLGMSGRLRFIESKRRIEFENGAKIDFSGLDDPEKIKGISNYKRVFKDELSEFDKDDDDQIRKRLRGMEGQQIIDAFNPISESHWIKTDYFDREKWNDMSMRVELQGWQIPSMLTKVKSIRINSERYIMNPTTQEMELHEPDTVVIQTTYLNNFWVVGSPDGTFGFYDRQCVADFEKDRINNPFFYNVYALGEWGVIQTGSEFFSSFERGKHAGIVEYNPTLPVHISVDNNALPYITITYWQVSYNDGIHIRQIAETCAEPPINTVGKAASEVASRLKGMGVHSVILHGDASTKAANTIDEEKRSWMDIFIDSLKKHGIEVEDCVGNKNPSVILSGEYINRIYAGEEKGIDIMVSEKCTRSITDYMTVQKDANGGMLKTKVKNKTTGQTYEDKGHLSDTKRYFVIDVLKEEFKRFANFRKRNVYGKDGMINYYNPETSCTYTADVLYMMPDVNGHTVAVHGKKCGDSWHIVSVEFHKNVLDSESIEKACVSHNADVTVFECARPYFPLVRALREKIGNVRVKSEAGDLDSRIKATSSLVGNSVLFNPVLADEDVGYGSFIESLLDYGRDRECIQASACISGFIQFVSRQIK